MAEVLIGCIISRCINFAHIFLATVCVLHTVQTMSAKKHARRPETVTVPVRMPITLSAQLDESATAIGLSKQDTMRLSLERGLKILTAQLNGGPDKAAA